MPLQKVHELAFFVWFAGATPENLGIEKLGFLARTSVVARAFLLGLDTFPDKCDIGLDGDST